MTPLLYKMLLVLGLTLAVAPAAMAQRPKSEADAVARYRKAATGQEDARRRAVGDLGPYASAAATGILLDELQKAQSASYRMTVLRALGEVDRQAAAVVVALTEAVRTAASPRSGDLAAEGRGRQGDAGTNALGELLTDGKPGVRLAACKGLRVAAGAAARDLLLAAVRGANGRDRLPPFEALADRADPLVDELRLQLALDRDVLLASQAVLQLAEHEHGKAAELAEQLARRLGPTSSGDAYRAALLGLMTAGAAADLPLLFAMAASSRDPFGDEMQARWQALLEAAEVRKFVLAEAQRNKDQGQRRAAIRALAFVPAAERATTLTVLAKLAGDADGAVAAAAIAVLAGHGDDVAGATLDRLRQQGSDANRAAALAALHELRNRQDAWAEVLFAAVRDKAPPVRTAALQLLARLASETPPRLDRPAALQVAGENLGDPQWQVRAAAVDLLVAVRLEAGIPWLIERVDAESARLREDVVRGLFELTRLRFPDGKAWREFWAKASADFKIPPRPDEAKPRHGQPSAAKADTAATYWDIPVRSERVAFVVDVSGSMRETIGTGKVTRLDEAKRQLLRVLEVLPAKAKVNIVGFGTTTTAWAERLQPLDKRRRKAAAEFVQALEIRGATNVHDGLKVAFDDPEVDTIFLLTDGYPSAGEIVAPDRLARAVAAWNLGRGIRIHTVAIGGPSTLLERLAEESGGEHAVSR